MKQAGRRITQLTGDLRDRRRYWELKKEAEDRKGINDRLSHLIIIIIIIIIITVKMFVGGLNRELDLGALLISVEKLLEQFIWNAVSVHMFQCFK